MKTRNSMVLNVSKISRTMKNKSLLIIEKSIEWEKTLYCNHKKIILLEKKVKRIAIIIFKNNDLKSSFDEEYKEILILL